MPEQLIPDQEKESFRTRQELIDDFTTKMTSKPKPNDSQDRFIEMRYIDPKVSDPIQNKGTIAIIHPVNVNTTEPKREELLLRTDNNFLYRDLDKVAGWQNPTDKTVDYFLSSIDEYNAR